MSGLEGLIVGLLIGLGVDKTLDRFKWPVKGSMAIRRYYHQRLAEVKADRQKERTETLELRMALIQQRQTITNELENK